MAKASIALAELVEKGASDDVVRELLTHIVRRVMDSKSSSAAAPNTASAPRTEKIDETATAIDCGKREPARSIYVFQSYAAVATSLDFSSLAERLKKR